MGSRAGTHFSTMDYEQLGRAFGETLMDYYDENPMKVIKIVQVYERLIKKNFFVGKTEKQNFDAFIERRIKCR